MEKKGGSKVLFFMILLVCIICITIILLLNFVLKQSSSSENDINSSGDNGGSMLDDYGKSTDNSVSRQAYFNINTCVDQFLSSININSSAYYGINEEGKFDRIVDEEYIKKVIYDLLSKKYINKNNINMDNIYNFVKVLKNDVTFVPLEAKVIQNKDITSFLTHGLVETTEDFKVVDEIFMIVNIDAKNNIFSIEPIYGNYTTINQIKSDELENEITLNDRNWFYQTSLSAQDASKEYIDLYKKLALGAPERMYNILDKEYREARFGSVENFKKYIEENRERIIGTRLEQYKFTINDDYTQFVCIDQYGSYYIFREKAVLDYTVLLDTYSVDLPEFIEEFEKASDEKKALMDIQKVLSAIKAQDYRYVYNRLDSTYKKNYFKETTDFMKYIRDNFSSNATYSYGNCEKTGDIYICEIQIKNDNNSESIPTNKKIAVKLGEGTNFSMSFIME